MAVKRIMMVYVNLISNYITGMIYAKVLVSSAWLGGFLGVCETVDVWFFFRESVKSKGKLLLLTSLILQDGHICLLATELNSTYCFHAVH